MPRSSIPQPQRRIQLDGFLEPRARFVFVIQLQLGIAQVKHGLGMSGIVGQLGAELLRGLRILFLRPQQIA